MEFKGTPGPWAFDTEVEKDRLVIYLDEGIQPHICYTPDVSVHDEANAKLIKSSPDLLEALQQGVELMEYLINATPTGKVRDTMCDFNIIARSAISKALD